MERGMMLRGRRAYSIAIVTRLESSSPPSNRMKGP